MMRLTAGITLVILADMKTAISIPDPLFQAAEEFADERGLSRSELYSRALQFYLRMHRYQGVTEALDQIYADEDTTLDRGLTAAQSRALPQEDW